MWSIPIVLMRTECHRVMWFYLKVMSFDADRRHIFVNQMKIGAYQKTGFTYKEIRESMKTETIV